MKASSELRVAVSGAAGFIGRAVVDHIERGALGEVAELRLNDVQAFEHPGATIVQGSYSDADVRARLMEGGIDILFHLASLPGGSAEQQPLLGKTVNLDGSMLLLDAVGAALPNGTSAAPIVVYSSSIAALGIAKTRVDDSSALRPAGSYGTHKAMVELYLADLSRRGVIDGRAVRLAGIVARPRNAYEGFATAWMSELFHAAMEQRDITIPARAGAHIWLQSIGTVADNIIHAALLPAQTLSASRAWTLPATVARVETIVEALRQRTGHAPDVDYGDSPLDHPPLDASGALSLGFTSDGDTHALVDAVISRLERQ